MTTIEEIRRIAEEIELKLHLASMDVRDRWQQLRPQLDALEREVALSAGRAKRSLAHELAAWRRLRKDMAGPHE